MSSLQESTVSHIFAFEIKNDKEIKPLISNSPLLTGNTRSQDQKNYFHPDGSIHCSIISLKERVQNQYIIMQFHLN